MTLVAGIEAGADGSGHVRAGIGLDAAAAAQLGDPARELRLDDLRDAGWTVTGPAPEADGLTWVRLAHPFETADEATRLAAQLGEPFQDLRLRRSRTFFKTRTSLTGRIDLSRGLAAFSDPALEETLGGADLGAATDDNLKLQFEATLHGRTASWAPRVGEQVEVATRAEAWNAGPAAAAVAALVFAITGLVVFAVTRR